jgi:TolA-binding protein
LEIEADMTMETPPFEEVKELTLEQQLKEANARIEELSVIAAQRSMKVTEAEKQKVIDDATIAQLRNEANALALAFNGLKAEADIGADKLKRHAAISMEGVDISAVLRVVKSAVVDIETAMTKSVK